MPRFFPFGDSKEQFRLARLATTKVICRKIRFILRDAGFAAGHVEQLVYLIGQNSFAVHAPAEFRLVELSAAHGAQPAQNLFLLVWEMVLQPLLEQRRDGVWQP